MRIRMLLEFNYNITDKYYLRLYHNHVEADKKAMYPCYGIFFDKYINSFNDDIFKP